ncbi:NUMOD4 motif-containing HNH endonuclease [bacterium]|jgi:hypothetical protein|nr:NUMOD4 motif-containing HNH endonuclease [bacterium]
MTNNAIPTAEGEIWKDVVGYEGIYMVSNIGRVKSLMKVYYTGTNGRSRIFQNEMVLKQYTHFGYNLLRLCRDGKTKLFRVHILVATAFIENPENLPIINHKDGVRNNNLVENLEWCTQAHNVKHAYLTKLNKCRGGRKVASFTKSGTLVKEYEKISLAVPEGFRHDCIVACCSGKHKEHKGLFWKYQ